MYSLKAVIFVKLKEATPQEFKGASIIHIKREILESVATAEASLIAISGKILAKIMLNRLNIRLDMTGRHR